MIKERLLALPEEIERAKKVILDKQNELLRVKTELKNWEIKEMSSISNDLDNNGKAKYSNDTKRQAELQLRKDTDAWYEDAQYLEKKVDLEVALLNIEMEKLLNEQGNLRAICRLEGEVSA